MICPLSPAHFFALGAFQLFVLLIFININLSPLPLIVFVLFCGIAPFLSRLSFFLPIISKGKKGINGVALTFDDGPDPETTPPLLELLAKHGVVATFFVTGVRAKRYPELIRAILVSGHTLANHSFSHSPFLMLKGGKTLRSEIASAQEVFKTFGVVPLAFRPPVGIVNAKLWRVLLELGMFCVNFNCRAADMGNRRVKRLAEKLLAKVAPRDIILLHDVAPRRGGVPHLLNEFETLIEGVKAKGLEILPLARLIGKEIMLVSSCGSTQNAAKLFYDGLAATYDEEQFGTVVSLSRTTEQRLFSAHSPILFTQSDRVLEIGAGSGIFTIDIARKCREVLALDISANMLKQLEQKAQLEGITNISCLQGNAEVIELPGTFSVVCAFLSFEYLTDLPAFLVKMSRQLEPGGSIYFTIARTSLFRFLTQIGNAMRQGLWLKSYRHQEIEAMLVAAGFERIRISSHLLKSVISGGMLLEVIASNGVTLQEPAELAIDRGAF